MAYKKILFRRDTAANWTTHNPVLSAGEVGFETNTNKFKIGLGNVAWASLDYFVGYLAGGTLNDLGDVTITSAQTGDVLRWNGSAWINDPINLSTDTVGDYVASLVGGTGLTITNNSGEGATPTIAIGQSVATTASVTFAAVSAPLSGNASTATKLLTARTIAGNSFDGSANINIAPTDLTGVTADASEINILDGAILSTTELNYVDGVTSAIQTQLNSKAPTASPTFTGTVSGVSATMVGLGSVDNTADTAKPVSTAQQSALDLKANLASPALTGTPTAPTAAASTNTTQVATTAFVRAEVAALVGTAGATLDTLGELAAALGNDASLSTTLTTSIGLKAPLASPTFTGTPTLPTGTIATTQSASNNTTAVATTAYVDAADALKANLASPTFTGTPTLPTGTIATTQSAADSTTKVATTAFVTTADNLKANIASPTFTGTVTIPAGASISGFAPLASPALTGSPTAPTQSPGDNSTKIATTAYANAAIAAASISALDDIGDVTITSISTGQFLKWSGSAWVNATIPTINYLDDIGDVTITGAASGQLLSWNGTAWVNSSIESDQLVLSQQFFS